MVRRENLDRYDDRLNIRINLIEAYDLLMDFVAKHLSDPFYLDGIQRVSLRDKIFREIVANLLVHRERGLNNGLFQNGGVFPQIFQVSHFDSGR